MSTDTDILETLAADLRAAAERRHDRAGRHVRASHRLAAAADAIDALLDSPLDDTVEIDVPPGTVVAGTD